MKKTGAKRKSNLNKHDSMTPKIIKLDPDFSTNRLGREFFNVPCYNLANFLLGKLLVRKLDNNNVLRGRIVETECYLGGEDKASHSFGGRRTPGNEPMYMEPGTAYVYMTYGMYYCMNISSEELGAAVLIRAIEPIEGVEKMEELRLRKRRKLTGPKKIPLKQLCNGPSKLCMSMDIEKKDCNKLDVCISDEMWFESDPTFDDNFEIVNTSRIGIDSVGAEWAKKPLRFYILSNEFVSKRDKKAEDLLNT